MNTHNVIHYAISKKNITLVDYLIQNQHDAFEKLMEQIYLNDEAACDRNSNKRIYRKLGFAYRSPIYFCVIHDSPNILDKIFPIYLKKFKYFAESKILYKAVSEGSLDLSKVSYL